ncbi:MAG: sugar phosphate isomerase/epimerase family protein [Gulosibacter sp.]|uniref:sugar phosphate isomerase/epimerase family protein n=1 Tax=Gulosibacter sp. TaxID=2817531 RepID=UPI003F8DDF45
MAQSQSLPKLIATCWTTAGDAAPQVGNERSPIDLATRIETAAEAGWSGFGIVHADLVAFRETHKNYSELARMLSDNGMEYVELEFLGDWWSEGASRRTSDVVRAELFEAAEQLDAHAVKVAPQTDGAEVAKDQFFAEFDKLATEAGLRGTRIALETMPFAANMQTLEDGIALVSEVGNPSGGLCVDIWHVARGNTDYQVIRDKLPAEYITVVELDDAASEPIGSLWDDTVNHRLLPGHGSLNVPEFINAIRATGYAGPWGVELISAEHRALSVVEATQAAYDATVRTFVEADRLVGNT